jgi:uncharacterized protein
MGEDHESSRSKTGVMETERVLFQQSTIHGRGAFAKCRLNKGLQVLEYLGEKIDKAESARRCEANNVYIFSLNDTHDLDGNFIWNPARLLNHSCSPNCEAELDADRIWLLALRDIEPGEELTFNYGFDLEDYRQYPCRCGSPDCVGFIVAEEFFEHVRRQSVLRSGV